MVVQLQTTYGTPTTIATLSHCEVRVTAKHLTGMAEAAMADNVVLAQTTCVDRTCCLATSELRTDTNDAFAFFKYVAAIIRNGYLQSGDVFVVDNARIHTAECILQSLASMLAAVGVSMVFLPKLL